MSKSILASATLLVCAALSFAGNPQSPDAQTSVTINGKAITIKYSAPSLRGRKMFGPDGRISKDPTYPVWRAGADSATALHTEGALKIGNFDIAPSVKLEHQATGDLDISLTKLAARPASRNSWAAGALAEHRQLFQSMLRPSSQSFTAHAAIDAARRALPRDGILSFDVGAHTHQIASQWSAHAPKSFLITNGWSSMGFGLPGAIAAKLARPELPVVCLIGDGCFQMTCGEVAVAKRLGLALPIVVLDDKWLALIKVKQIRRQLPLYGTALQEEDYREPPAHYFGVPAVGVRDADALEAAVRKALAASGPTVIEAVVDSEHYIDTVYD